VITFILGMIVGASLGVLGMAMAIANRNASA